MSLKQHEIYFIHLDYHTERMNEYHIISESCMLRRNVDACASLSSNT